MKIAGSEAKLTVPEVGELLVKFKTAAEVISVNVIPSTEPYTRKDDLRFPVALFTEAQSKLNVPAFKPEKFRNRSIVIEVVLSVVPVERKTMLSVPR